MESFIQLFGDIPLSTVIIFLIAIFYIGGISMKLYHFLVLNHDKLQEKDNLFEELSKTLKSVESEQHNLKNFVFELGKKQDEIAKKQERLEKERRNQSLNKLRDLLLQSYRYYINDEKNPMHAWSEMEKEAFDELFTDYEKMGGNGFMHSTVLPAMSSLEVINMVNQEKLTGLMKSRKG